MECGIEYSHHRHAGHYLLAGSDTDQICRIVKRCKVIALRNCLQYTVINHNRSLEFFSAMYDSVTYCINFLQRCDHALCRICQLLDHNLYCIGMILHQNRFRLFAFSGFLMGYAAAFDSDSFTQSLCQNLFTLAVDQLILQRGAAAVDYKHFHGNKSSCFLF